MTNFEGRTLKKAKNSKYEWLIQNQDSLNLFSKGVLELLIFQKILLISYVKDTCASDGLPSLFQKVTKGGTELFELGCKGGNLCVSLKTLRRSFRVTFKI